LQQENARFGRHPKRAAICDVGDGTDSDNGMNKLPNTDASRKPESGAEASLSDKIHGLLSGLRREVNALREELQTLRGTDSDDALLTREEAAERLRISTRTLDDLEASGRLQAVRIGRRVLYHPATLDAYVRSCTGEGGRR